jgi:hypothetical protein
MGGCVKFFKKTMPLVFLRMWGILGDNVRVEHQIIFVIDHDNN